MSIYRVMSPSASLRSYIRQYVYIDGDVPKGTVTPLSPRQELGIVVNLQGSEAPGYRDARGSSWTSAAVTLIGPQTRRNYDLTSNGRYSGLNVMFQPSGFFGLFGQPVPALSDIACDARDVLDKSFRLLLDLLPQQESAEQAIALLERFLLPRVVATVQPDAVAHVAAILSRSSGPMDLCRLAGSLALSERQLERKFVLEVGMTPKRFARVARFRNALQSKAGASSLSWTRVTHDAGYYDQNHLIKDFRDLTGATPSHYLNSILPIRPMEMFEDSLHIGRTPSCPEGEAPFAERVARH
jgi:AraC-like DNA-binding protein